ncbi:MAG TPA: hypothetical protein VFI22_06250, partial [Thermomicrobiales bacterium]|nr:hypothetical protein [Thermomicrobiales bacterium]
MEIALPLPPEPHGLKSLARTLLEQAPEAGLATIDDGAWLADPLWEGWRGPLERGGMDRERFGRVVADYRNEVRLWLMGERLWEQCVAGLAGRAARRAAGSFSARTNGHDRSAASAAAGDRWQTALRRIDLAPDAALDTLAATIDDLQLLHDLAPASAAQDRPAGAAYAIVWAGSRPRD